MAALLKLFLLPIALEKASTDAAAREDEFEVADLEETGYQAGFSKLGASEKARPDPVAYVDEPRNYLATALVEASQSHPGKVCLLSSLALGVSCSLLLCPSHSFVRSSRRSAQSSPAHSCSICSPRNSRSRKSSPRHEFCCESVEVPIHSFAITC